MRNQAKPIYRGFARRALALLAGLLLLSGGVAAGEEEELDLRDFPDIPMIPDEELEEVVIPLPDATLKAKDIQWHTPGEGSPVQCSHEHCYWNTPMGYTDEAAVWEMLMQPVTVLDVNQRQQYKVRKEPDKNCTDYTGLVTGTSQAVHVLDRGEEWTLIEAYSSATEGSKVKVYATKFQGYVETSLLKEVTEIDDQYAIVIDKQFQRLYVYSEGKLFSTLLCSTGYVTPKKKNYWNETPAGEFLCVSWTGDFFLKDDEGTANMRCGNAIRINDGILIHEVPSIPKTDSAGKITWTYDRCERYLGEKASHGCIRVQRKTTPEGVNHEWLWKHLSNGTKKGQKYTKVIIWDDAGRTLGYPDDNLKLYWNSKNYSGYYHSSPDCVCIKGSGKTVEITYADLDTKAYRNKKACAYCAPMPTREGIDTLNAKNDR